MKPDHHHISDDELLRQMRTGTAAGFQLLYRRHQAAVYRYALLRCGSGDTAADVVQEVFMALLTGGIKFDPLRGSLPNFLVGVARNTLLKLEQPRRRLASLPEDEDGEEIEPASEDAGPLAQLLANQLAEQVRLALARLAPHYRDVVILYELQELSYVEIADICRIDIGTMRSRLSRARAALVKLLAPQHNAALPLA